MPPRAPSGKRPRAASGRHSSADHTSVGAPNLLSSLSHPGAAAAAATSPAVANASYVGPESSDGAAAAQTTSGSSSTSLDPSPHTIPTTPKLGPTPQLDSTTPSSDVAALHTSPSSVSSTGTADTRSGVERRLMASLDYDWLAQRQRAQLGLSPRREPSDAHRARTVDAAMASASAADSHAFQVPQNEEYASKHVYFDENMLQRQSSRQHWWHSRRLCVPPTERTGPLGALIMQLQAYVVGVMYAACAHAAQWGKGSAMPTSAASLAYEVRRRHGPAGMAKRSSTVLVAPALYTRMSSPVRFELALDVHMPSMGWAGAVRSAYLEVLRLAQVAVRYVRQAQQQQPCTALLALVLALVPTYLLEGVERNALRLAALAPPRQREAWGTAKRWPLLTGATPTTHAAVLVEHVFVAAHLALYVVAAALGLC